MPEKRAFALSAVLLLAACSASSDTRDTPVRPAVTGTGTASWARAEAQACFSQLASTRATFSPVPDRTDAPGCFVRDSVAISRLGADQSTLEVTNLGPLACPMATRFAAWARYGVDRAARQILGSPLARIETMGSYACRNVAGTRRLSAHSRAQAVDIGAFILQDGRRVSVKAGWTASREEREFLRTVHRSACKRFGTVLGPDYNAAHRDHLHLELGDGSFCR